MRRVVLLTDFGTADGYAAALAGVIAAGAPAALVEHASHDIAPGDVLGAALALSRYAGLYPEGTVHLVVVDPGVGTGRRALAARIDGRLFVAPDNGVLTLVLRAGEDIELADVGLAGRGPDAAPTFHGRDIFAPAAARLVAGARLDELGDRIAEAVTLPIPEPEGGPGGARGVVIHADRFGNLITNIPAGWVQGDAVAGRPCQVRTGAMELGPVRRTYADVRPGEPIALVGSIGLLEVAVRDGSAAAVLGLGRGARIDVF
jgi:S-adenosyl-L-methionine hydrolase (adenosine-forming)